MNTPMIVGTEWLVEAKGCDEDLLRNEEVLRQAFASIIADLGLKTVGKEIWHKFPGEGGVTGLVALTESHLACHTYPEYKIATFNLYCCKDRPEWDWKEKLCELIGAKDVSVTKIERGTDRNAGVSPAVAEASRFRSSFPKVKFGEISTRERGRLPHWERENGVYFVTFRLADSLPKTITNRLKIERNEILKVLDKTERELSLSEKQRIDRLFSSKINEYLDGGFGNCILRENKIAEIVANSLKHFDGERYDLFSWCVMPNHVHVVFRTLQNNSLDEILHSWKSFTAHEINRALGKNGKIWQREYYDRLIRDQEEFERVNSYVLRNPAKANLLNWKWVSGRLRPGRSQDSQRDAGVTVLAAGGAE